MIKNRYTFWILTAFLVTIVSSLLYAVGAMPLLFNLVNWVIFFSLFLTSQNLFTLSWMLYGWSKPENEQKTTSSDDYLPPKHFFTLIIPARNEEKVIGDTIKSLESIDYPKELFEILVVCKKDDEKTINAIKDAYLESQNSNLRLILFDDPDPNKPKALNIGLSKAKGEIIGVFDAEDEPGRDILRIINNTIIRENVDVVQSGVQLMNHNSHWFSPLNVLEYYFWFKSGLLYFSKVWNMVPLGGNTVFFKKEKLKEVGGWDENCLTEDADIGIRLAKNNAKVRVIYDDRCLTKEETPHNVTSFVKQRTRWMQGFMQILFKGDWLTLPYLKQRVICLYILLSPIVQSLLLIYIPFGLLIVLTRKLPLPITLISYMPFYLMLTQLSVYIIGLYTFGKSHRKEFSINLILNIFIFYYPYQLLLAYSSFRAISRQIMGTNIWEKTRHLNNHRLYE